MRTARAWNGVLLPASWAGTRTPIRVARNEKDGTCEVSRGAWWCRVSADTTVTVLRKRRLRIPLAMIAIGMSMVTFGVLMGMDPAAIVGGAIWAALGFDSCTRVKPTNFVRVRNGSEESEVMSSQDHELVNDFVEEITAKAANLKAQREEEETWSAANRAKAG
jgi:hypothetical protein